MEEDKLSMEQYLALLWGGLLGAVPEVLPGGSAPLGLWSLGSAALLWGLLLLAGRCLRPLVGERGLAEGYLETLGLWPGRVILLLYIVWGELLLASHLLTASARLSALGERDGGVWFFLGALSLAAFWMCRGKLAALGRCAQLMLRVLGVTGGLVLLLALFRARSVNLLSGAEIDPTGAAALMRGALSAAGPVLLTAFLPTGTTLKGESRTWRRSTALRCAALGFEMAIILGSFGPTFAAGMERPFFQLAKTVGVEGGFQRLESVVTAVWSFGDLLLLAGILFGLGRVGSALWPGQSRKRLAFFLGLPGISGAARFYIEGESPAALLPFGTVLLGILLPWGAGMIRKHS